MFIPTLKNHFHPFVGRILFWNAVMLVFVKLILPQSAFQLASFVDSLPVFDSREVIRITNESRAANGLLPLQANSKLDLAANEKLKDMAGAEYFAHVSPTGVNPWFWIKKANYNYSVAGENLAIGFVTAKDTVQAWMNSPSHKANILNTKYQEIGVAIKGVEIDGREGVLVVQMFGRPVTPIITAIKTTPVATPSGTPQLAVSVQPTVNPGQQTQGESITVQYVTTETNAEPVTAPAAVVYEDAENVKKISDVLNNIYSAYTLFIAVLSAVAFFMYERSRSMAMKISFNAAVFILSVIIPAAGIKFEGLIF